MKSGKSVQKTGGQKESVLSVAWLFRRHLPLFERLFFTVILIVQMFAATFILIRLAKNSKLIHSFEPYIPAIQQILEGGQYLGCKLKFDQLLHRLTSGPKYGMSVGAIIVPVTYDNVVKVHPHLLL